MIRLGNIIYSNCYPVHARLLESTGMPDLMLVDGTPAELNRALEADAIDVAPCSSIEYARHADRYRVLPGLAIASVGAVESILLETTVALEDLAGREVAVPTASATSVVLLRVLLECAVGVRARFRWFDQTDGTDPIEGGAAAALRIGDVALMRAAPPGRVVVDLGRAWTEWTGLPFVFAVWQTRLGGSRDDELCRLTVALEESRAWFGRHVEALAERRAADFGVPAERLSSYWKALRYTLDERATQGLLHFFALAAELGEVPAVRELSLVTPTPA